MAELRREGSWEFVLERLADEFVQDHGATRYGNDEFGYDFLREREPQVRTLLLSYGARVLAAAATGGALYCDDGSGKVPCDFILRPDSDPYFRCAGHDHAHCYNADYSPLSPCP